MNWEWIEEGFLRRGRVPWGWLVYACEDVIHDRSEYGQGMVGGWDFRPAMTFVFDPFHNWKINTGGRK